MAKLFLTVRIQGKPARVHVFDVNEFVHASPAALVAAYVQDGEGEDERVITCAKSDLVIEEVI